MITNTHIARTKEQIFASSSTYTTPFYNRDISKEEVRSKFSVLDAHQPFQFIISYPLGTGKSFFIEQISSEIAGSQEPPKPLFIKNIYEDPACLETYPEKIIFVDECDIKTPWEILQKGLETLADYTTKNCRKTVIVGDYTLRNPELEQLFQYRDFLNTFEPVDSRFLKGVITQRSEEYLGLQKNEGKEISLISKSLYEILTPTDMVKAVTFRSVLSVLESIANLIPFNDDKCILDTALANEWLEKDFDPPITTQKQEDYLNLLLEYIAEEYPRGKGLRNGLTANELFAISRSLNFSDFAKFKEDIISPFVRAELLVASGIPSYSKEEGFIRHPEPYYPSTAVLLLAEQ